MTIRWVTKIWYVENNMKNENETEEWKGKSDWNKIQNGRDQMDISSYERL